MAEFSNSNARLYWEIGTRIHTDILANQRAEYGGQVLQTLAQELTAEVRSGLYENERTALSKKPDESIRRELDAPEPGMACLMCSGGLQAAVGVLTIRDSRPIGRL